MSPTRPSWLDDGEPASEWAMALYAPKPRGRAKATAAPKPKRAQIGKVTAIAPALPAPSTPDPAAEAPPTAPEVTTSPGRVSKSEILPSGKAPSAASPTPAPAPPADPTSASLALLGVLEDHGYTMRSRHDTWWEVCITSEEESWLGAGSTEDDALRSAVAQMVGGSHLARRLLALELAARARIEVVGGHLPGQALTEAVPARVPLPPPPPGTSNPSAAIRDEQRQLETNVVGRLAGRPLLLAAEGMERDLALRLGRALQVEVVCCDRSDQQLRSQIARVEKGTYAAVVHLWGFGRDESPFAMPCARRKVPLAVVTLLRPTAIVRALAEAMGAAE